MSRQPALDGFHPLVREWFLGRRGEPTAVQAAAWERIRAGENVLALAPTGSGKTLAAFLDAISRLVSGELPPEGLSVLYVSPLKALNEDVRRNLETPLAEIAGLFAGRGEPLEPPRVETRSGDTPQAQRRRFLSKPPAILCTTPESLAILLDSPRARPVLSGVRLLILDEIHALAGSKRGALLACSVGRLALLAGEFQRVALSATVRPAETAAAFVAGRILLRDGDGAPSWIPRRVAIVAPAESKSIEFSIEWPEGGDKKGSGEGGTGWKSGQPGADADESRYDAIVPAIAGRMRGSRSVLVFTDSRRRAERIAFLLNELEGPGTAWAHHGSLAREARLVVEERFKRGELRCVVATASLELGIDIGSVDEVVLAGAPQEVAVALQRAGRAGHGVGQVSRATLYPFHGMDLIRSAAVVEGAIAREIEELRPPVAPLDILAQVLLSLAAERDWDIDAMYDTVLCFPPFERLARSLFDATLAMLAGRYGASGAAATGMEPPGGVDGRSGPGGARLRELEPRVYLDAATGTVRAKESVRALLWSSGGAIPDRGHYSMRVSGSGTRIGELDEEFVFERSVGDAFTLGTQSWRIVSIGNEAVEVAPLGKGAEFIPFWKGEAMYRSPVVSSRMLGIIDRMAGRDGRALADPGTRSAAEEELSRSCAMSRDAARVAVSFIASQASASGGALPGRGAVLLEVHLDPARRGDAHCVVLHSLRGGAVNQPLALALAAALEETFGVAPDAIADDDFVLLIVPAAGAEGLSGPAGTADIVKDLLAGLAAPGRLDALVRSRLEGSGLFGAQFRENAGRALLIARGSPGKRNPLWVTRLRARRLFEAVSSFPDFPVTAETWRSCLVDLFDLERLKELVEDIASGRVAVPVFTSRAPSPFAREAIWRETGEYMYQGDALSGRPSSSISDQVIEAALASSRLRPRLAPSLVADFERRVMRLLPGWGPATPFELAEWVKEIVLLPADGLAATVAAGGASLAQALGADPDSGGRILRLRLGPGSEEVLVHAERAEELAAEPAAFVAEWLRRRGPVAPERIASLFGLSPEATGALLDELEESGEIVVDEFRADSGRLEAIDAENLEILLRMARRAARPEVEARPASELWRVVARLQRLALPRAAQPGPPGTSAPGLADVLGRLEGFALPARLWETEVLPVRMPRYAPQDLDALFAREPLLWYGTGREELAFSRPEALETAAPPAGAGRGEGESRLLAADGTSLDFWELKARSGLGSKEAALALWKEAWEGKVSCLGFEAVRHGLRNRFGADLADHGKEDGDAAEAGSRPFGMARRVPAALRGRWKSGAPVQGEWFSLALGEASQDALDREELDAERVRIVARRYGLLCRAVLEREGDAFRWGALFPAMRRMELRGELVSGRFFEGIEGAQFMSPEAFELYRGAGAARPDPEEIPARCGPVWLSALDPAATPAWLVPRESRPSGSLDPPDRIAGNRLAILDGLVVALLSKSATSLDIAPSLLGGGGEPPGDPVLMATLAGLAELRPRLGRRIALKTICGTESAASPLAGLLAGLGFEKDRGSLVLW